jgi:hypothetical protein
MQVTTIGGFGFSIVCNNVSQPPFRRAVPTTPADRTGASLDYFPRSRGLPRNEGGSASNA